MVLLFFIPFFLYGTTLSIVNEVKARGAEVYGLFDDILYRDPVSGLNPVDENEFKTLFPHYSYESYGVFYTVAIHKTDGNRKLNIGFADSQALSLGGVTVSEGRFPEKDNEIALTRGNADVMGVELGQNVTIGEREYTVSGIVNDFGRLWVRGEMQIEQDISPVNAFVTTAHANAIYDDSFGVLQQIVISSTPHVINRIEDPQRTFSNNAGSGLAFNIPSHFRIVMYVISVLTIISVLMLSKDKLFNRLKNYHLLGIEKSCIKFIVLFEMAFITLISFVLGAVLGLVSVYVCLGLIFTQIDLTTIAYLALSQNILLVISMFAGFAVVFFIYATKVVRNVGLESDNQAVIKAYKVFERRVHIFMFDLRKNIKTTALIMAVICLSSVFIAYGVTYGNYFTEEMNPEAEHGFIAKDYDFQFVSNTPSAPPMLDDIPVLFTNIFEKIGADPLFCGFSPSNPRSFESVIISSEHQNEHYCKSE